MGHKGQALCFSSSELRRSRAGKPGKSALGRAARAGACGERKPAWGFLSSSMRILPPNREASHRPAPTKRRQDDRMKKGARARAGSRAQGGHVQGQKGQKAGAGRAASRPLTGFCSIGPAVDGSPARADLVCSPFFLRSCPQGSTVRTRPGAAVTVAVTFCDVL